MRVMPMGLKKVNRAFGGKCHEKAQPTEKKGRFHLQVLNIAVFVLCAVLIGSLILTHTRAGGMLLAHFNQTSSSSGVLSVRDKPGGGQLTTEQAAARILPAVVGIVQYQKGSLSETGEGSGILMSADGRIITNNHVVEGANHLDVVLRNGKHYTAALVGTDARTDLAVVKINAQKLPYAQFGDSEQCKVGQQVIAVGNPSGLELAGSVTQGIISALNRNVDVGNGPMNLIQTDAAINPGNSGGALVNMYGQVIGINSAKIAQTGYEGLGFSIPICTAQPIVDSILRYGYVKGRVKFGLNCREIDTVTAQINHIPQGIYIGYVEPGSSAEQNGVKADDIITAVDGQTVKTTDDLINLRDKHKPGETLKLTLFRRGDGKTYQIAVALLEDKGAVAATNGDW
ncbi:MAG: trypsin-like peptidase domain-containing protein [Ethanoligenens sp.]